MEQELIMRRISKFNNKICYVDNKIFHSQLERTIYLHLAKMLSDIGGDLCMELQYPVEITPKNGMHRAVKYIADFFIYKKSAKEHLSELDLLKSGLIIDAKGLCTATFTNKRSLLYHMHGLTIHTAKNPHDALLLVKQYIGR